MKVPEQGFGFLDLLSDGWRSSALFGGPSVLAALTQKAESLEPRVSHCETCLSGGVPTRCVATVKLLCRNAF